MLCYSSSHSNNIKEMIQHTTGLIDGVHFFRWRKKTHLSLSTWTTRPLPSSVVAAEEEEGASGPTSAIQPRLLAHIGHWCWANSSKFFSIDSKDNGTLLGDSSCSCWGSALTARLRIEGEAGSDTLMDRFPSWLSSLYKQKSCENIWPWWWKRKQNLSTITFLPVNTLERLSVRVLWCQSTGRCGMIQAERLSHVDLWWTSVLTLGRLIDIEETNFFTHTQTTF